MGNTNSGDSFPDTSNTTLHDLEIEVIVNKLKVRGEVNETLNALKWVDAFPENKKMLDFLAATIIKHALSPEHCSKYLKLAKELSEFSTNKEEIKFKDIFIKKSIEMYAELEKNTLKTAEEKDNIALFLGNLFNAGIISSTLINHFLIELKQQPKVMEKIQKTIEEKVKLEFQKPDHERHIDSLMQTLQTNKQNL
jgi:hypothetical protein